MKRCSRCRRKKPDDDFAWRRKAKGQRDSYCRPCRAEYKQEHYAKNKKRYLEQATARNREVLVERTEYLIRFFTDHPCVDCGVDDVVVLEFDHLADKEFDIGFGIRYRKWESVLAEITKCEVVCVNCHRHRTAARSGCFRLRTNGPSQQRPPRG